MKLAVNILVAAALAAGLATGCGGGHRTERSEGGTVIDISPEILAGRADTLIEIGTVREGEIILYDAWLRNTGQEPLVIVGIDTSCGCTTADYEKQPIAVGDRGHFSFRFDSRGMWGVQMKLIEIRTSASQTPYNMMVRAEVEEN